MSSTSTATKHTPTPWHVVDGTRIKDELMPFDRDEKDCQLIAITYGNPSSRSMLSDEQAAANAAFIVLAVNSYYEMRNLLEEAARRLRDDPGTDLELVGRIESKLAALAAAEA